MAIQRGVGLLPERRLGNGLGSTPDSRSHGRDMNQACVQYVFGRGIQSSVNKIGLAVRMVAPAAPGLFGNGGKRKGEFHEQESDER